MQLNDDLQRAESNGNEDRAYKLRQILRLEDDFAQHCRFHRTENAFHSLKLLKQARRVLLTDKPLLEPPELASRIRDSDREPHWVPGIYPTIFQNETGDPFNYYLRQVDLQLWGPHVLMSKGWFAQTHATFLYWWMNTIQRMNANASKKWFVAENPDSIGWTRSDMLRMDVKSLARRMTGYTAKFQAPRRAKVD